MAKFKLAQEIAKLSIEKLSHRELEKELLNLYILLPSNDLKDILKMLKG